MYVRAGTNGIARKSLAIELPRKQRPISCAKGGTRGLTHFATLGLCKNILN